MIAVDTNLLVYAHRQDSPWYEPASNIIKELAESPALWAIPWPCVHEFLAIVTHPRIYRPPTPLKVALDQVDAWLGSPSLVLLAEDDGYWAELRAIVDRSKVTGPMIHDAHVAALCRRHAVNELWSADRDFGRFGDLKIRNPLVARA